MKKFITAIALLLLISCEGTIYYPDINSYRDNALVGTWYSKDSVVVQTNGDVIRRFYVYEQDGYYGQVFGTVETYFESLGLIWEVNEPSESNNWIYNQIHESHVYKSWTKKVSDYYCYYNFLGSSDTLVLYNTDYVSYDTLYKYPTYQLIYDGHKYVGIDSTGIE